MIKDLNQSRRYLSEKQAANYLNISVKTLQRHRTTGFGPEFAKLVGRVVYDRTILDAWVADNLVNSTIQNKEG